MERANSSPQKLNMRRMYNAFVKMDEGRTKHLYFADGLGIVLDVVGILSPFMGYGRGPFLIEDFRFVICRKGSFRTIVNLQEMVVREGMMAVIVPGSIVEPLSMSSDFTVTGMGVSEEHMRLAHSGELPELLCGKQKTALFMPSEEERQLVEALFAMEWSLIKAPAVGSKAVDNMLSVITQTFSDIFRLHDSEGNGFTANPYNRKHKLLQNFIDLINEHCCSEHKLDFYADRLCVTTRYLGTIIHEVSGITAKEWLDRAVITIAKVLLRHSSKSVSQIADELHFPSDSFFCKYFKRLTGLTPSSWRNDTPAL